MDVLKRWSCWVSLQLAEKGDRVSSNLFTVFFFFFFFEREREPDQSCELCVCVRQLSYTERLSEGGQDYPGALYASISRPDTCGSSSNVCYMCVNNKA